MMNVFVPTLQRLGLENAGVWHTAYGDYPMRLLAFVADEKEIEAALNDDRWKQVEARLKQYITDYTRRIVPFEPGFQF
jgi:O-methyltransferase involved in polyketide biosynthesis